MALANRTGKDGKTCRCQRPCRKTLSIRSGTFFEGSNLLISTIIKFIYNWAYEILDYKLAKREFNMGTHAFVDWKRFLRDICAEHFIRHPLRIGGPGVTVEIDKSVFTRRKYNRGRMVMVPVDQRNADTLLPIIQQYILLGTTIVSDCWAAYNTIGHLGYNHLTVNHTYNFVDPITYAHTNTIENMWMRSKRRAKKKRGTKKELLPSYMEEFVWRLSKGNDPFHNIIVGIRENYPQ